MAKFTVISIQVWLFASILLDIFIWIVYISNYNSYLGFIMTQLKKYDYIFEPRKTDRMTVGVFKKILAHPCDIPTKSVVYDKLSQGKPLSKILDQFYESLK